MADPVYVKRFERTKQAINDIAEPLARLDAARQCRQALDDLELAAVRAARDAGATWKDVGALYGLSKQGAQQRFRAASDQRAT